MLEPTRRRSTARIRVPHLCLHMQNIRDPFVVGTDGGTLSCSSRSVLKNSSLRIQIQAIPGRFPALPLVDQGNCTRAGLCKGK